MKQTICLLNDSFPPLIDGVANTVVNYAKELPQYGYQPTVITPAYTEADDSGYPYPIIRYPSLSTERFVGYPAGVPFSPEVATEVKAQPVSVLHSHCPIMSTFMARQLRQITDVPIVLTYHSKFDVDIDKIVKYEPLRAACKKALSSNISACDEVWVVSQGAGENLRRLGYTGDYLVMPNGVDVPLGKAPDSDIAAATNGYDLPGNIPVYLFVGRMMWYKGLRIIIDALSHLKTQGKPFRMVFIGGGEDLPEVKAYAQQCGIEKCCVFTGPIHDRSELRAWYGRADLLLFPSTYDTNGLVVREAAASGVAAVLIKDSCAAEGILHGRNGYLITESAEEMSLLLQSLSMEQMHHVGEFAAKEIYISWHDAIKLAAERYAIVIDRYKSGQYVRKRTPSEGIMRLNGEMMEWLSIVRKHIKRVE